MKLILIRHGQTEWNAIGRWQGQADPPLNEAGWAQARRTADEMRRQHIDALFSSDLLRARQTANAIAEALGVEVQLEPRLREVNLGAWQGLFSDDIRARWPDEVKTWLESPLAGRPPGGESIPELAQRVVAAANDIAARHPGQRVAVVAHELPIAILTTHAAGIPLEQLRAHMPPNAAWREIEWP